MRHACYFVGLKGEVCIFDARYCGEQWLSVGLFVLGFSSYSRIFHSYGDSPLPLKAANFDLCSALMAIEQLGFFSVPHLLWHGASVFNSHVHGPVTLTLIAKHLAVELSLPVFKTCVCHIWDSNTQPVCRANTLTDGTITVVRCQ